MKVNISEIQLTPVKAQNGLVAFTSFVMDDRFFLGGIAVYTAPSSPDGYRLVYPTKMLKNGTNLSIAHPISKQVGYAIQEQVIREYLKLMENLMKGDNQNEEKPRNT